jgi:hypothetical protein
MPLFLAMFFPSFIAIVYAFFSEVGFASAGIVSHPFGAKMAAGGS